MIPVPDDSANKLKNLEEEFINLKKKINRIEMGTKKLKLTLKNIFSSKNLVWVGFNKNLKIGIKTLNQSKDYSFDRSGWLFKNDINENDFE